MILDIPEHIQEWIQRNYPSVWENIIPFEKYIDESNRYISTYKRYELLKRQKWKCNQCNIHLKYSNESDWEGEVAHVDHIHPYSKRESYQGIDINEIFNLQALCPKCNLTKKDKEVH